MTDRAALPRRHLGTYRRAKPVDEVLADRNASSRHLIFSLAAIAFLFTLRAEC
jgi:hypothetical protein